MQKIARKTVNKEFMIEKNKVSLWLGRFDSKEAFMNYINITYDEDGNEIPSCFQADFGIKKYDFDAVESDWISEDCADVASLLVGFTEDEILISRFENLLKYRKLSQYNSILLIYDFNYSKESVSNNKMDFIGSVDIK